MDLRIVWFIEEHLMPIAHYIVLFDFFKQKRTLVVKQKNFGVKSLHVIVNSLNGFL